MSTVSPADLDCSDTGPLRGPIVAALILALRILQIVICWVPSERRGGVKPR